MNPAKLAEARIPRAYWGMTRQAWKDTAPSGLPTPWPAEISAWVKGEAGPIVSLLGPPGVGKSHIAVATLIYYLASVGPWGRLKWWNETPGQGETRTGGAFFTARELAFEFNAKNFNGRPQAGPLLQRALAAPLVVVDDVFWDRSVEDFQRGAVASLIHNAEQTGAGVLLTMNVNAELFSTLDGRIASRLAAGLILPIEGEDRR